MASKGLRLSVVEYEDLTRARQPIRSVTAIRDEAYAQRREKAAQREKQKYGNHHVEVQGIAFDSKAEARYWLLLQTRLKAKEIKDLERQVVFELAPSVEIGGRKRPPLRYIADFTYIEVPTGRKVVADVKGVVADAYRIKRHLMKSVHGIDIVEIRA